MGITHKRLKVKSHRNGRNQLQVDFLVDSGVVYSLVSSEDLKSLDIDAYKEMEFSLADGQKIKKKWVMLILNIMEMEVQHR